ncbi:MAG: tyrosine-type recombinase/integrase [Gaiellaceae bacterium]
MHRGEYVEPTKETLAAYLLRWLPTAEARGLRPSTLVGYRLMIEKQIIPRLGSVPMQRLAPVDLNGMYAELLSSGHRQREGGLSPRTVRYIHTILRKALSDAVRWGIVTRNVADSADPPSTRAAEVSARKSRTFWNEQQVERFLGEAKQHRLHAAFHLATTTGMRRGEVLGLRWRDLDLDGQRLRVEQTLIAPRYQMQFSEPKTDQSRRSIDLDPETVTVLREHRKRQLEDRLAFGRGYADSELVFRREDGEPVVPALFSLAFKQLLKTARLPEIRLRDLRHTHAALLGKAGVPPKVVQERLGHHSAGFTLDNYGGSYPSQHREAAEAVAALVRGSTKPA